jgi:sporulation protein YlmC with PRC-barrel domain
MLRDDFLSDFQEESAKEALFEKENLTGNNEEGPYSNKPVKFLTATSIIGDQVENEKGESLGEIKNIMINIHNGCSEYVILEFGGFLGMGTKYFAVPFSELRLDPYRRIFVLDKDKEYFKNAPGFDKAHWPETNSRHYSDVDSYWYNYSMGTKLP